MRKLEAIEVLKTMGARRAQHYKKQAEQERLKSLVEQPRRIGNSIKWPFQFMEIGEQIKIHDNPDLGITAKRAYGAAKSYSHISKKLFTCRTSSDGKSVIIKRLGDPQIGADGKRIRVKRGGKIVRNRSWPFKDMKVGTSVFIPIDKNTTPQQIMGAAHSLGGSRKFRCRFTLDGKGVQVYRVS